MIDETAERAVLIGETVYAVNEVFSLLETASTQSDHTIAINAKTTLSWCNRIALLPFLSVWVANFAVRPMY